MKNYFLKPLHHFSISVTFLFFFALSASAIDNFPRDVSFNSNTSTTNSVTYATEVIKTGPHAGKIMMAGEFNTYNNTWSPTNYPRVVRLNSDGSLDKTFRASAFDNGGSIYTVAVQPDGKVIVGGIFSITSNGKTYTNVLRLDLDGNIDPTFNPIGGGTSGDNGGSGWVKDIVVATGPDGLPKIWIGGRFETYNGTRVVSTIYDPSNSSNNRKGGLVVTDLNGNIYANPMVEDAPISTAGGIESLFVTASGQVLIGGEFGRIGIGSGKFTYARRVARMNNDGSFDNTFLQNSNEVDKYVGPGSTVYSIAEQILPSGESKIIIGGSFKSFNDVTVNTNFTSGVNYIARLNVNGSLDNTFSINTGTGFNNNQVWAILADANGRLIIAGGFTNYNGYAVNRVLRLLPDGTFDPDFNIGDGFASTATISNPVIYDLAFQPMLPPHGGSTIPEGYMLATGYFNYYNGSAQQSNGIRMVNIGVVLASSITNVSVVKLSDSKSKLTWEAAQAAAVYIVERSFDGKTFQKIASYFNANSNSILSHEDIITNAGKVYYRIGVTANSSLMVDTNPVTYSGVVSVNLNTAFSANLSLMQNGIKVYLSSKTILNEQFSLKVVTMAGQQLVAKQLLMNSKVINETIWSTHSMKNCLIVLSDSNGEVLKKVLFK